MKNLRNMIGILAGGVVLTLWLAGASLFIVYPWESALVLQFGEVVAARQKPGLYFKLPWQNLRRFDWRSRMLGPWATSTSRPKRRMCWWTPT